MDNLRFDFFSIWSRIGGESCATATNRLHFDSWYTSGGQNGYWQVETASPVSFLKFSIRCTRSPGFAIKYSDSGSVWSVAAKKDTHSTNPEITWGDVGAHRYWRYELTGDWSGGPWYNDLQFFSACEAWMHNLFVVEV